MDKSLSLGEVLKILETLDETESNIYHSLTAIITNKNYDPSKFDETLDNSEVNQIHNQLEYIKKNTAALVWGFKYDGFPKNSDKWLENHSYGSLYSTEYMFMTVFEDCNQFGERTFVTTDNINRLTKWYEKKQTDGIEIFKIG